MQNMLGVPEKRRRRRTQRLRVDLQVDVSHESEHNFYSDLTRNAASCGLFVRTSALRRLGDRVRILLNLPGLAVPVELDTVVAWVRDVGDVLEHGMGLRFLEPTSELRDAIKRFIKQRDTLLYEVN
jgi:uncharacterized protein (TIGR02266 family)